MMFNPTITTEALRMAVELYKEEMRLAIAYVEAGEQVNIQTAHQHFRRAEAAHFIVGLLFDAAQMQDDLKPADGATPIRVEKGSSQLVTVQCPECFNETPDTQQDQLICPHCGAVLAFDEGEWKIISPATKEGVTVAHTPRCPRTVSCFQCGQFGDS